jgi:hypothetical protein
MALPAFKKRTKELTIHMPFAGFARLHEMTSESNAFGNPARTSSWSTDFIIGNHCDPMALC